MALAVGIALDPAGVVSWAFAGLAVGWFAGGLVGEGRRGRAFGSALGLLGALTGGFLFGLFGLLAWGDAGVGGRAGFWGSLAVAYAGAWAALLLGRRRGKPSGPAGGRGFRIRL